jgi:hypothetical protein
MERQMALPSPHSRYLVASAFYDARYPQDGCERRERAWFATYQSATRAADRIMLMAAVTTSSLIYLTIVDQMSGMMFERI